MKVKTSVTLSSDLVARLDELVGPGGNRSAVMERALETYLSDRERRERDAVDLEILERDARRLNQEAADVIGYQDEP